MTYMHACMHASMHPCMHASMHPCIHAYMHASMHPCIHAYMHTCIQHASMHTCIHAYIQTDRHTYIPWDILMDYWPHILVMCQNASQQSLRRKALLQFWCRQTHWKRASTWQTARGSFSCWLERFSLCNGV